MITNKRKQLLCTMLAASLSLCLPNFAHGEEPAAHVMNQNMAEMKFGAIPGLPTCAKGAVETGDPGEGAFILLAKIAGGCTFPWHWHTATENLMIVSGAARLETKDGKPKILRAGGFSLLPSHHVHQFTCTTACTLFLYSDGAFDIHYVDAQGKEMSPDEALKAVKEKAAKAS